MSQLEVDKIIPQSGTTLTIGDSGDTVNFADGTSIGIDTNTLYIDSTNNRVGIGTTSPVLKLDVDSGSTVSACRFVNSTTSSYATTDGGIDNMLILASTGTSSTQSAGIQFSLTKTGETGAISEIGAIRISSGNSALVFRTRDSATGRNERMRIDSSGNVLVGTTNSIPGVGNTDIGISLRNNNGGSLAVSRGGDRAGYFNRNTSDGEIVQFRKDGTAVGNIGANSSSLYIAGTSKGFRFTASQLKPCDTSGANDDGNYDLGSSSTRFKDLYLGGGLYVGGTAAANKLDDYEEGEYDITATDSGGGATITLKSYTNRLRYTKIGTTVHVQGRIQTDTVTGTYSGSLRINLPFTAADLIDTGDSVGAVLGHYATFDAGASPACWVNEGVNYLDFKVSRSGNSIGDFTLGAGNYLIFQVTYVTN